MSEFEHKSAKADPARSVHSEKKSAALGLNYKLRCY